MVRVFKTLDPGKPYFAPNVPEHSTLNTIILSSSAFVLEEPENPSYQCFLRSANNYLVQTSNSYLGGKPTETKLYTRVRIKGNVYTKVPLFFPFFCNYTATTVQDLRRPPDIDAARFTVRSEFSLYDYQEQVRDRVLPQLRSGPYYSAILHAVCGAGKTGMTCYTIGQLGVRTVILVNTNHLMGQWVGELKAWLGLDEVDDIGYIGGGHDPPADGKVYPVLICMLQSLRPGVGGLTHTELTRLFQPYDLCVSDECHHMPATTFRTTVSTLFKGRYRLALTATLERADDMERLVAYMFGPVACRVVEDLERSTYTKYLHTLHYTNPDHSDRLYLPQWRPGAKPKLNYGLMMSRVGDDVNRLRLTVQYVLRTFPGQRILFLSKMRCQAEYVAAYLQFREHVVRTWPAVRSLGICKDVMWTVWRMSHDVTRHTHNAQERIRARKSKKKKSKKKILVKAKKTRRRKKKAKPLDTKVFLYMGGNAGSADKRARRDHMLEHATYISCTAAIAGEAFNIRNVHVLVILSPQKPNGALEQFEGRIKRGKFVDQVDVVTLIDKGNPTFATTGQKQIRWFREQQYQVFKPLKMHVDNDTCPPSQMKLDAKTLQEKTPARKQPSILQLLNTTLNSGNM